MGRFLLGLIVGVVLGVLATAYSPNLVAEARAGLASLTALVMRGAEQAAETVDEVAEDVANEA